MNDLKEILRQEEVSDEVAEMIEDLKAREENIAAMLASMEAARMPEANAQQLFTARQHFEIAFTMAIKGIIGSDAGRIWSVQGK